jgi:lipopolysaccharide biosynthesis glycosyltransferase
MKWFSGVNNHNKERYFEYIKMYSVAVLTAKETNPNLKPYLILDGEIDEYIQKLIDIGVTVIQHQSLFITELKNHYKDNTTAFGAFLRVDIPKICEKLLIDDEYVLYTDNDVFFVNDISELKNYTPTYFMAAGEFTKEFNPTLINTGVMWINWKEMNNIYDEFVFFIKLNLSKFQTYDQDAIRMFFNDKCEELNFNYNYKPYWGESNDIKILHFHGPKPTFNDVELSKFPYPSLITSYFNEMTKKFNTIYDNYYLLNT